MHVLLDSCFAMHLFMFAPMEVLIASTCSFGRLCEPAAWPKRVPQ